MQIKLAYQGTAGSLAAEYEGRLVAAGHAVKVNQYMVAFTTGWKVEYVDPAGLPWPEFIGIITPLGDENVRGTDMVFFDEVDFRRAYDYYRHRQEWYQFHINDVGWTFEEGRLVWLLDCDDAHATTATRKIVAKYVTI
jgi:hypothetical protein